MMVMDTLERKSILTAWKAGTTIDIASLKNKAKMIEIQICCGRGNGYFYLEDIEEIDQLIKAFKRARAFMEK